MIKSYARDIIILRIVLNSTKRGNLCLKSSQSQTRKAAWVKQPLASISQLISQSWASAFLPSTSTRRATAAAGSASKKNTLKYSVYSVLSGEVRPQQAILPTKVKGLDILPANIDLAGAEVELVSVPEREKVLKKTLSPLRNVYDYIIIDCPPSLALLTVNALTLADSILIPIQGEFYALEGLSQLMNTIKLAKRHLNQSLSVEGVVLTMYDSRSRLVQNVTDEIAKFFGNKVFATKIPRNVRLGEAPSYGLPIMLFDPKCSGSVAYKNLAEEFLMRNGDKGVPVKDLAALKYRGR